MVGGFLVAAAALAIFAAYLSATAGPDTTWVVAARDLSIGQTLRAGDVELVPIDLPEAQASRSFNVVDVLEGAVVVAPLQEGELVQQSAVAVSGGPGLHQLSFSLPSERALLGVIKPNERVDVLATYGQGTDAYTVVVVRGAQVLDESDIGGGEVGGSSAARAFTIGVPRAEQALAVSHALNAGVVSLVRTTAADADEDAPDRYRPSFEGPGTADSGAGGDGQEQPDS